MGAGELFLHLLAEGVVPDNPVSHEETQLISYYFYIRGVLITYGYVERAAGLEDLFAGGHPVFCPCDVVFGFDFIVVLVVFVADVEGRVGKDEVDKGFAGLVQYLYAIAAGYLVEELLHNDILHVLGGFARGFRGWHTCFDCKGGGSFVGRGRLQIIDSHKGHESQGTFFHINYRSIVLVACLNMPDLLKWLVSFVDKDSEIIRLQSISIAGDSYLSQSMNPQSSKQRKQYAGRTVQAC
jgi:hypothetical protein